MHTIEYITSALTKFRVLTAFIYIHDLCPSSIMITLFAQGFKASKKISTKT